MRTICTKSIVEEYSPAQIALLFDAFFSLLAVKPDERHFVIKFADDESVVWVIIDDYPESEGGKTATLLLPQDY